MICSAPPPLLPVPEHLRVSESGLGFAWGEARVGLEAAPSDVGTEVVRSQFPTEALESHQQTPFFESFPVDSTFSSEAVGADVGSAPEPLLVVSGARGGKSPLGFLLTLLGPPLLRCFFCRSRGF